MKYGVLKTTVDSRRLDKVLQKQEIDDIASGRQPMDWTHTSEEVAGIMQSYIDQTEMVTIANMPNVGQIENLPLGSIVETKVKKGKDGSITPIPAGTLPETVRALCSLHTTVNEMVVEAAMTGDRKLLISAMSLDPSTGTMDFGRVPELCEELLSANRAWLPRFFD